MNCSIFQKKDLVGVDENDVLLFEGGRGNMIILRKSKGIFCSLMREKSTHTIKLKILMVFTSEFKVK